MAGALEQLEALLGRGHVLTEAGTTARYLVDERALYHGAARAVIRPGTRTELADAVAICHAAGIAMVPQGGNTGYCGGATPDTSGEQIVVSLERLDRIIEVDVANACLTLEAGVVLSRARDAAAAAGLLLPLAMGSMESCQIGGNLATNAGGLAVLRYGTARDLTLGLEVVLADGRVLDELSGLRKDNTGYDLKQLFIGAEGTLGIISAACLKLFPRAHHQHTAFVAVADVAAANSLLQQLRDELGDNVTSCEYMAAAALAHVALAFDAPALPVSAEHAHFVLLEWDAPTATPECLVRALGSGLALDAAVAQNDTQRRQMWWLRENIPAAERHLGGSVKHDISVPRGRMPAFIESTTAAVAAAWPQARLSIYGHLGDGNIHFNVVVPPADAGFADTHGAAVSDTVHDAAMALGGSFSAEHGVGAFKRDLLGRYAAGPRLDTMRVLKQALDPGNVMNPGKLL